MSDTDIKMSDVKMSELFTLPLTVEEKSTIFGKGIHISGHLLSYNMKSGLAAVHAISSHDALVEQNKALRSALCDISNMCVGNLTMSYSLDAQYIGELIYSVTGLTNPELNDALEQDK